MFPLKTYDQSRKQKREIAISDAERLKGRLSSENEENNESTVQLV